MTVIYARTSLPRRSKCSKPLKNVIRVTNRYTNAGAQYGVVPIKNRPIMSKVNGSTEPSDLKLSTHYMRFPSTGDTKSLGITTTKHWKIV